MLFFGEILALDYGTRFIKGILYRKYPGDTSIISYHIMEIVSSEHENNILYNIEKFVQTYYPEQKNLLLNFPGKEVFIRDVEIPVEADNAIREIIPFEVENMLPFSVENMEVLYTVWKKENGVSNALTCSCHQDYITGLVTPLVDRGYKIYQLSVDSYCLYTLLYNDPNVADEVVAQMDIGADKTILNVVYKGKLCYTRYIETGSSHINEKVAKLLKTSEEKAEELKKSLYFDIFDATDDSEEKKVLLKKFRITKKAGEELHKVFIQSVRKIAREISRSIATLDEEQIPSVLYVSGGGSKLNGINNVFRDELNMEIRNYNLPEINNDDFMNCYGIIRQFEMKNSLKMDFLATPTGKNLNKFAFSLDNFRYHIYITGAAFLLFMGVFAAGIILDYKKISANETILKSRFEKGYGKKLDEGTTAMEAASALTGKEYKNTEIFRKFYQKESILDIMADVSEQFPPAGDMNFEMSQFVYDDDIINIYGNVNEITDVGMLEESLKKSRYIKNTIVVSKKLLPGKGDLKVKFQLKLELKSGSGKG